MWLFSGAMPALICLSRSRSPAERRVRALTSHVMRCGPGGSRTDPSLALSLPGAGSVPRTHVWAARPRHGGTEGGPLGRQGTRR